MRTAVFAVLSGGATALSPSLCSPEAAPEARALLAACVGAVVLRC